MHVCLIVSSQILRVDRALRVCRMSMLIYINVSRECLTANLLEKIRGELAYSNLMYLFSNTDPIFLHCM